MSLWGFMLSSGMAPFSAAFALILLFLVLEVGALLFGGSLFGVDGDADLDVPDLDVPSADVPSADVPDVDMPDVDVPDADIDVGADGVAEPGGALVWLGLGEAPFLVWLVALLLGFGLTGYAGQLLARELFGDLISPWPVAAGALVVGLTVARRLSRAIARMLPRIQTEAVSERRLGSRVGVITVGTARVGQPAEAKVTDRFGNAHYIRVVPHSPGEELPAGTEIAVMGVKNRIYRAMRLNR